MILKFGFFFFFGSWNFNIWLYFFTKSKKRKQALPTHGDILPLATWRRISYYELQQATGGFFQSNLLGVGSFGSVYQVTLANRMCIAVKIFIWRQKKPLTALKLNVRSSETFVIEIWSKSSAVVILILKLWYLSSCQMED